MRFRSIISICFCAGASTLPIHRCLVAQGSPRPKVGSNMAERFVVWGCLGYAVCHCNSIDLHIVLPKNLRTHGDPHKAPKTQGLSQLSSSTGAALLSGACSTPAALQPWQEPFSTRIHSKHAGRLGSSPTECGQLGLPCPGRVTLVIEEHAITVERCSVA